MHFKIKNVLLFFGFLATIATPLVTVIACASKKDGDKQKTSQKNKPKTSPQSKPSDQPKIEPSPQTQPEPTTKTKPEDSPRDKPESSSKTTPTTEISIWFHSKIIDKINNLTKLTPENVAKVLTDNGINVNLSYGTSYKHKVMGDKYGDFSKRFIPRFKTLSSKSKNQLTIEAFGKLFGDGTDSKFRITQTVVMLVNEAFTKTKKPISSDEKAKPVNPRTISIPYEFNNAGSLKYDDSWWSLNALSYSNDAKLGKGSTYYRNLKLDSKTNKYPQFNIEDWINVYDSSIANVLTDPKHTYDENSPDLYKASNLQFASIYNHTPALAQVKTGNNNNGLNALYSGAGFAVDSQNKVRTFDTSFVETIDHKYFEPDKTISNGWEHVSPQSEIKNALKDETSALNKAKGDLHNIRPSIEYLFNSPRSNLAFGVVIGDENTCGVDFEIGMNAFNYKVVEPRVNVRGDIARIMFYMHDRYHVKYDLDYYKQLALWAAMDPVTKEEKTLDNKIAKVMGFHNEYVTGTKIIPYDETIKNQVKKANNDKTPNVHTWGIAPKKKQKAVIDSLDKARALDWSKSTNIPYGIRPSHTTGLKDGGLTKQVILKVTMQKDGSIKYFKVTGTQSKAILAKEFNQDHPIKIAINDQKNDPKQLKTLLSGNKDTPYASMVDLISEISYLIVE